MKILVRDFEQAFRGCTTLTNDGIPVRVRHFEYPDDATMDTELETDEVRYVLDNLRSGDRMVLGLEDLAFLMPPEKLGWVEIGERTFYVSHRSTRQWRKGLTSRRVAWDRIRPVVDPLTNGVTIRHSSTRMEFDYQSTVGVLTDAQNRTLGKAVGISINRLRGLRNALTKITRDVAICMVGDGTEGLVFYEDTPVGVYVPNHNTLIMHPDNACFEEHVGGVFTNTVFAENMEKFYERIG